MLIPVRVVVDVYSKQGREEREWHYFFKDTELPLASILGSNFHRVQLKVGDTFHDFMLQKERSPLCVEGIARIVVYLDTICDTSGTLLEKFHQNWTSIEHISDAEDFVKTPEPPKTKKTRARKVKTAS